MRREALFAILAVLGTIIWLGIFPARAGAG